MTRWRLLVSILIGLTSPLFLLQGLANAEITPGPVNWNGFRQSELSLNSLQVEQEEQQFNMTVREGGVETAKRAFAKEPLASDALFLLAADYRAQTDLDTMQEVLSIGVSLDKRNRNLGTMQLEQAAISGNISETFDVLDRLATTNPRLTPDFVAPLTLALEDGSSLELLREALERGPIWREAFWRRIPSTEQGIVNMLALRGLTSVGTTEESDKRLLAGLARTGMFEEALDFWDEAFDDQGNSMAFVPTSDFQPIGWRTISSGERSFSPRGANRFGVFVVDQTSGELGRQLVRLRPGRYGLSAQVIPANEAENVQVSLECAVGDAGSLDVIGLDATAEWLIDDMCEVYWLKLLGSAWDRRTPLQAEISNIEFERLD